MKIAVVILGIANLAIASLITSGVAFSSYGLAALMALLIVFPILTGLILIGFNVRWSAVLMTFGSAMICFYLIAQSYHNVKYGNTILPFHVIWALLSAPLLVLALRLPTSLVVQSGSDDG